MKYCVLFIGLLIDNPLYSSEVDSFRLRFTPLEDSLPVLNAKANEMLQIALSEANTGHVVCSERRLYSRLRRQFRNHIFDQFNRWIIKDDQVPKIETSIRESIYRDFNIFQSPIQGGWARVVNDPTGSILNVGGIRIGNDKFEHFMGSGFKYFRNYYQRQRSLEHTLNIGWRAETGAMGAMMTGVMSYGDMMANFQGMRFWNHMLQQNDDIFGDNLGPYITCLDNQWTQVKQIDFAPYLNVAFDEGINCSKFRTQAMTDSVLYRISEYEKIDTEGRSYSCPLDADALNAVYEKFSPISAWLINLDGHQAMKDSGL
jgi:hypothetical protein